MTVGINLSNYICNFLDMVSRLKINNIRHIYTSFVNMTRAVSARSQPASRRRPGQAGVTSRCPLCRRDGTKCEKHVMACMCVFAYPALTRMFH